MNMLNDHKMTIKFLLIGFMMMFAVKGANAIMCYHCNSAYDPRCGDPFNPFSLGVVNCSLASPLEHVSEEPTLCRKTTQKVYGVVRVVRGCGYITDERDDKQCLKRSGTHDVHALYCACTTDLCNHSNQLFHQHKITFAAALVPLVYLINQRFNRQL